jgi:hypothetical protein
LCRDGRSCYGYKVFAVSLVFQLPQYRVAWGRILLHLSVFRGSDTAVGGLLLCRVAELHQSSELYGKVCCKGRFVRVCVCVYVCAGV